MTEENPIPVQNPPPNQTPDIPQSVPPVEPKKSSRKHLFIVAGIVILVIVALGGYLYYKIFYPIPVTYSGTSSTTTSSSAINWKTYVSTGDKVKISYPQDWIFTTKGETFVPNNPKAENFHLTKSLGSNKWFQLDIILATYNLGGACPGYNSKTDILETKQINIFNTKLLEIFQRDYSGSTNNVGRVYVLDKTNVRCLNVSAVKIKGLPGLFVAEMYFYEGSLDIVQKNSQKSLYEFKTSAEYQDSEKVLQSLQFTQ